MYKNKHKYIDTNIKGYIQDNLTIQTLGKEGIGKSRSAQLIKIEQHPCFLKKKKVRVKK